MEAVAERTRGLCRAMPANYEVKDPESGPPLLFGHFVVWDSWAEIDSLLEGHFYESFARGSWDKTIHESKHRMRCLFQHGEDPQVGRKVIGPINILESDDTGVYYEVPLFGSVPDLIVEGLRAQQYGSSALFDVIKWKRNPRPPASAHNPDGLEERVITEVKGIEFGPCVFNYYSDATAVARSETDAMVLRKLAQDPERFKQVALDAGIELPKASTPIAPTLVSTTASLPLATTNYSVQVEAPPKRRYKRAVEAALDTVWAVRPQTLQIIMGILEERRRGVRLDRDELADRISDGKPTPESKSGPVAVIPVGGTIMPHGGTFGDVSQQGTSIDSLQGQFQAALADPNVESILFNIDSPGGSVDLVEEMHQMIMSARGVKPIEAVANTMAASAAYYIASAADRIAVTPSGQVGSIGVYTAHNDISQQQANEGVKTTLVSAGENKVLGNPYEPLSEEAMGVMQKRIDAYYQMFVGAVAAGRGVDAATVEADFGQGDMFLAQDAVEAGLADTVETYAQVYQRMAGAANPVTMEDSEPELLVAATHIEPEPLVATTQSAQPAWIYGQTRVEDKWTLPKR